MTQVQIAFALGLTIGVILVGLALFVSAVRNAPVVETISPHTYQAMVEIGAERARQIGAEGWTPEHDDEHGDGSLASAAACYAVGFRIHASNGEDGVRAAWLWPRGWQFNPADRRRELVKAGALIVAEIERLDRKAEREGGAA